MLASGALGYVLLGVGGTWEIVVGTILALDGLGMGRRVLRHRSAEPGIPGAATGLVQTGDFAGSLVGPVLFGILATGDSYRTAWLVAAGLALLGVGVEHCRGPVRRHVRDAPPTSPEHSRR